MPEILLMEKLFLYVLGSCVCLILQLFTSLQHLSIDRCKYTGVANLTVYVIWMVNYGTEAIMAVPAHDTRDHEFALKYDIPIRWVVTPDDKSVGDSGKAFPGHGTIINSSNSTLGLDINGMHSKEGASKVIEWAEKSGNGKKKLTWQRSSGCAWDTQHQLHMSLSTRPTQTS